MRYYTPERLPHILHTIAADYRYTRRSAARAAHPRPEARAAPRISAPESSHGQTAKAPAAELPQGEKKSPAEDIPTG